MQSLAAGGPHEALELEVNEPFLDVPGGPHDLAPGHVRGGIDVEDEPVRPVDAVFSGSEMWCSL